MNNRKRKNVSYIEGGFEMLLEFTFKNLFSYKNESYFSMEAAKGTKIMNEFPKVNGHRILKSAIVFGSNASGKSNLIQSLNFMGGMISRFSWNNLPFPSFAGTKDEPIILSATILKEELIYRYTFSYFSEKIVSEKLEIKTEDGFEIYFDRQDNEYLVIPDDLVMLIDKTPRDFLFLEVAKTFNDAHSFNVTQWFAQDLLYLDTNISRYYSLTKEFAALKDEKYKAAVLKFMQAADVNIEDIVLIEETVRKFSGEELEILGEQPVVTRIRLRLKHRQYDEKGKRLPNFTLDFSQESEGTRKLLYLASIILTNKNRTILIDEFDKSLHFELSQALLELFNSPESNNQFILTTHQLSLMDFNFKKEQIYFVERKDDGVSDLYSAYDFSIETNRKDYSYLKRYMEGQFGATPIILLDTLKETIKEVGEL